MKQVAAGAVAALLIFVIGVISGYAAREQEWEEVLEVCEAGFLQVRSMTRCPDPCPATPAVPECPSLTCPSVPACPPCSPLGCKEELEVCRESYEHLKNTDPEITLGYATAEQKEVICYCGWDAFEHHVTFALQEPDCGG